MKIQKKFQGAVPENKIVDIYSTSRTDTYSCNYVNNKFIGEYGEWTPTLVSLDGEAAPTVSFTTRTGYWYRIGNLVFVQCYMRFNITELNGAHNYARVDGFPFSRGRYIGFGGTAMSIGIIYACINGTTENHTIVYDGSGFRLQNNDGAGAAQWQRTTTAYADLGFSGFIELW